MSNFVFPREILKRAIEQIDAYKKKAAEENVASIGYDISTTVGQKIAEAYLAGYDKSTKQALSFFEAEASKML